MKEAEKEEYYRLVRNIDTNEFCYLCIEQEAYELDHSCTDCPIRNKIKKNKDNRKKR